MEVNFYQIDIIDHRLIAGLLLKIREEGKRVLIYSKNREILKQIDDGLWSFSKTKFLPHATGWDNFNPLDQIIFLTDVENNENNAQFLITTDSINDDFLKNFEKVFYFFDETSILQAREIYLNYKKKSIIVNSYKKENDKWIKS